MKVKAALLTAVQLLTCIQVCTSAPLNVHVDQDDIHLLSRKSTDQSTIPSNQPSHLNLNDIMDMVTNFRSVFKLLKLSMSISPPLRDVIAQTSKVNAEFRIVFKLLEGQSLSLSDIVEVVTKKHHSMWDDYAIASRRNPTFKKILEMMKGNNLDVKKIIQLVTGKDPKHPEFKDDKYTVTSNALEQDQNFIDFVLFVLDNWSALNAHVFPRMFTSPVDYTGVLTALVGLDFKHYPMNLRSATVQTGGSMAVLKPPGSDVTVDGKLTKILNDVLVLGPQIIKGRNTQSKAKDDVLDIFQNVIDASTMMLQAPSQEVNES